LFSDSSMATVFWGEPAKETLLRKEGGPLKNRVDNFCSIGKENRKKRTGAILRCRSMTKGNGHQAARTRKATKIRFLTEAPAAYQRKLKKKKRRGLDREEGKANARGTQEIPAPSGEDPSVQAYPVKGQGGDRCFLVSEEEGYSSTGRKVGRSCKMPRRGKRQGRRRNTSTC